MGYLHIQNSENNSDVDEVIKKDKIINILQIIGFIIDILDYFLITNETLAPDSLHEYYSEHKFLIQIIYILGALILIGSFSLKVIYKANMNKNSINNNSNNFNKVELK